MTNGIWCYRDPTVSGSGSHRATKKERAYPITARLREYLILGIAVWAERKNRASVGVVAGPPKNKIIRGEIYGKRQIDGPRWELNERECAGSARIICAISENLPSDEDK
jgi:hypothetical protein